MPEKIRIDEEKGYLDLIVTGSWNAEELRSHIQRVTKRATEAGVRRVLADLSGVGELPTTTALYEIADTLPRDIRHAIVAPAEMVAAERVRFFETASMNFGLAVRIYATREVALEWLLA